MTLHCMLSLLAMAIDNVSLFTSILLIKKINSPKKFIIDRSFFPIKKNL